MKIDKDTLKSSLSIDEVFNYVMELGGDPKMMDGFFIARTICHNAPGTGSYKLYYYDNTHLFRCYTDCGTAFDIFELTCKTRKMAGQEWGLPQAVNYVASYFGYSATNFDFEDLRESLPDWEIFKTYEKLNSVTEEQKVELKPFDQSILKHFPHPHILPWEKEGIHKDIMDSRGICYNPINHSVIIPHYDMDNNLIGIRERTLIKEDEVYGKYRPAVLAGKMYNHPLSFNLYNLNNSKENIKRIKKVFIGEGEKFCLKYASWFGAENDISVACCGSSLITYQVKLLLSLGVEEIIIAFDKQWQQANDEEFKRWVKKLKEIHKKYSPYVTVSFLFDKQGDLLGYKESPVDRDIDTFLKLFERRIIL